MMIERAEGKFTGGPLDAHFILHDVTTGRYHVAFFEETPFPGAIPNVEDTKVVRLKSKMHHTSGAATLEEAKRHLDELVQRIELPEENIFREPLDWDGQIPIILIRPNWRARAA